jgi:hypothetical protein
MSTDMGVMLLMCLFPLMAIVVIVLHLRDTIANPFRNFRFGRVLRNLISNRDGSIIFGSAIKQSSIVFGSSMQVAGYEYSVLDSDDERLIVMVSLKQPTLLHIVGIGSKSKQQGGLRKLRIRRLLSPVQLEGDFSSQISLYCNKGQELELLQIFDPADMAYFADFCRAYDFEIYDQTLYITQAGNARDDKDKTGVIADAKVFLQRNGSLLERL